MTELKPCPHCGSERVRLYYYDVDDRCNTFDPCVRCENCGVMFKFCDARKVTGTLDDIMDVWNRRVKE